MPIGIVDTRYGKVKGITYEDKYKGITIFKGIPYAKPPVGNLRWAPPESPEPWEGVRVCNQFGAAPPQNFKYVIGERDNIDYYYAGYPQTSEDCLYLSVCTGANRASEKRPVYIWFHGGGLKIGCAWDPEYNPQELARKGIVVVHVGQRVGAFGYLSLPQLSAEQGGKSGNYGLMDQFKALDWICENIEAFGGDPDNITIGGQSGGSHKTCAMAASPANKGRVKRVINETGLRWAQPFPDMKTAEKRGREYLRYQGLSPDLSLEQLRALSTDEIYGPYTNVGVIPGEMVCDGDLVPFTTMREAFDEYLEGIDFINSTNMGEADVFADSAAGFNDIPISDFLTEISCAADFYAHFANLLGSLFEKYDFTNLVKVTDENAWFMARRLASLGITGRVNHSYPGWAANFGKNLMLDRIFGKYMKVKYPGSRVYTMLWSHFLPTGDAIRGTSADCTVALAWHSSEMWYTFGSLREGVPPNRPWTNIDFSLADIMTSYWANFIRTGNPNGEGLPYWPASSDDYGYIEVIDTPEIKQGIADALNALIYEFVSAEYKVNW